MCQKRCLARKNSYCFLLFPIAFHLLVSFYVVSMLRIRFDVCLFHTEYFARVLLYRKRDVQQLTLTTDSFIFGICCLTVYFMYLNKRILTDIKFHSAD